MCGRKSDSNVTSSIKILSRSKPLQGVNNESVHVHLHAAYLTKNRAKKQIEDQHG